MSTEHAAAAMSPILAGDVRLPPEVQRELMAMAQRRTLVHDQLVFQSGENADALFGVVEGSLRVSVLAANGNEAVVSLLEPGHWFGEISLFTGLARVNNVRAVGASEIALISASEFHRLIAERPDIHLAFTRLLCLRLRLVMAWIDDAILHPLPVRLAARLLAIDARRADPASGALLLNISQEDLALSLGVSRQTVNRQLKLWELDGTLAVRYRCIELLNPQQLARHATGSH